MASRDEADELLAAEMSPDDDELAPDERDAEATGSLVNEPLWEPVPEDVVTAVEVDWDADDPAMTETNRQCVSIRSDGTRCRAYPMSGHLVCSLHGGRLDPSAGGHALAEKRRRIREASMDRASMAILGTRAVVARALEEKAVQIHAAVQLLADAAAGGDKDAAKGLIPWINQALGMPTERVEHGTPQGREQLEAMSTQELENLVTMRRRERLKAVEDAPEAAEG